MQKIIVPTDFSPLAEHALDVAIAIGRKTGAVIELLHISDIPYDDTFYATGDLFHSSGINDLFTIKSLDWASTQFDELIKNKRDKGVRFLPVIRSGHVHDRLYESIVKEKADLIVMGTEETKGLFKGVFNSSHTEEVAMHAQCMVLTVKEHQPAFKLSNVVFASDFTDYNPLFIDHLKALKKAFGFHLHLLYVHGLVNHPYDKEEVRKRLERFIEKVELTDYTFQVQEDFNEYEAITSYTKTIQADMIAICTHQQKGFWHFIGGLSEDLIHFSDVPVLTYVSGHEKK